MKKLEMTTEQIKNKLIEAGVRNLKAFGYPDISKDNILTVPIFSMFFKSMLEDECNSSTLKKYPNIDKARKELLAEINKGDFQQ